MDALHEDDEVPRSTRSVAHQPSFVYHPPEASGSKDARVFGTFMSPKRSKLTLAERKDDGRMLGDPHVWCPRPLEGSVPSSSKLARRRSTLGTLSNASNDELESRRASISSFTSHLDLLTALQQTPAALATDRRGYMDILNALRVGPDDVTEPRHYSRRASAISIASSGGHSGVDLLQALRDGPSLARSRYTAPLVRTRSAGERGTYGSRRSSVSSHSGALATSLHSQATTHAPLIGERDRVIRASCESSSSSSDALLQAANLTQAQATAAASAFAMLRRRLTSSKSDVASQLLDELAAAAAEHACAPTPSTADELDQVAQEVADSHGMGQPLTAALARGGYPPLALCTPADAARLWRDLKGVGPEVPITTGLEAAMNGESLHNEELLDEGRRRWSAWRARQLL